MSQNDSTQQTNEEQRAESTPMSTLFGANAQPNPSRETQIVEATAPPTEEKSDTEEDESQSEESAEARAPAAPVQTPVAAKARLKHSARDDEPYEWDQCTIVLTIELLPLRAGEAPEQRRVVVAARTHSDPPFYKLMTLPELGELPKPASEFLDQLRAALPAQAERRKAAEAEREQAQEKTHPRTNAADKQKKTNAEPSAAPAPSKPSKKKKVDLNALPELPGFGAAG
jgi:hypothetical protein